MNKRERDREEMLEGVGMMERVGARARARSFPFFRF